MSELLTKCSVCQGLIDEEDLFCANCGAEAPPRHEQHRDERPADQSQTSTHNFTCQGCGASMSYDASAGTLRCPFCGSERLQRKRDTKVLSPQWVAPFAITRDEAVASMRRWLARGFWRPGDLSQRAAVVKMTPVYVPYWVFEATTHTYWTADTSQLPPMSRGNWRPLSGEHRGRYENLLVGASGALAPGETGAICPFDLSAAVAPEEVDLENAIVEQFQTTRRYARPLARQGLEALESQACTQYVPARCRNMKVNTRIEGMSSQPALLPVWIMAYRYREHLYRFLVNGQTGKATGQAPTSIMRIAAALGVGALVLLFVLLILSRMIG